MGLLRRSRAVPVVQRVRVSWWTSTGVACLLLITVLASRLRQTYGRDPDLEIYGRHLDGGSYPDDLFIEAKGDPRYSDAGNKYLVFIHVILIGYMFLGLNTVCDIYFTGALDVMVDQWNVKPDVAGATFMAAGGSAPELFSSLIGAVYLSNDVGFSTIVGSAVFNVLFVIGLCGAVVSEPIPLTWWPLLRDCVYYICGLSLLAVFSYTGNKISVTEAAVLFAGYILYCIIMYYNSNLENFVKAGDWRVKKGESGPKKLSQVAPIEDQNLRWASDSSGVPPTPPELHEGAAEKHAVECTEVNLEASLPCKYDIYLKVQDAAVGEKKASPSEEPLSPQTPAGESMKAFVNRCWEAPHHIRVNHFPVHHSPRPCPQDNPAGKDGVIVDDKKVAEGNPEAGSNAEDDAEELMVMPEQTLEQIIWFVKLPIYGPLYYLTPKPTEDRFPLTFLVSLLWIAGYSYFLIWLVDVIVGMISMDINIAGITVLAAGTSIPDLVSSAAVARAGEGDMAVSSSIGSNIFDILVGLPFPWMIKILIVEFVPGYTIKIQSPYIVVYVLILLLMVFCVILSIHSLGWKLNKCLGICMSVLYGVFMCFALILEIGKPEWAKI